MNYRKKAHKTIPSAVLFMDPSFGDWGTIEISEVDSDNWGKAGSLASDCAGVDEAWSFSCFTLTYQIDKTI